MNKSYYRFLSLILIIAVIGLFYPHQAEAGGAVSFVVEIFEAIVDVVDTALNVIINLPLAILETAIGGILGIDFLSRDGNCRLDNLSGAVLHTYDDECGEGGGDGGGGALGSPTLNSQIATPIKSNESCTTGFTLSYSVTDAYQYAIYRDGNLITQATLSSTVQPSPFNSSFSYDDTNLAPATTYIYKLVLVSKDGEQFSYPEMNPYTECSPHIVFNGPNVVEYPNSFTLSWIAENVTSLIASGDWSGSKEMGTYPYKSESLSKPRGTYTFILSGTGPSGSASKQVTVQVIKIPRCTFAADPTSIILPQTSVLSWSCSYADTCSIDQGVGSVNPISGTQEVRPSATTTYTLACNGSDGERTWQSTVNVGFTPRLREVAP